tara:strand:+ start:2303 stop:2989 length:687 start_codon:yes stop_codon:yes gene_type:complete
MKPNTLILGPSGTGKSSSIRNLPKDTTIIFNTERKTLPFREGKDFKMNFAIHNYPQFDKAFEKALKSDKITHIVVESLTSLIEMIDEHAERVTGGGFDKWNLYNQTLSEVFKKSKSSLDKYVAMISIDQVIESAEGISERYAVVQGNRWKKSIEKEFVNVLYSTVEEQDSEFKYVFLTNKNSKYSTVSAKTPLGLAPEYIPNDLNLFQERCEKYFETNEELPSIDNYL